MTVTVDEAIKIFNTVLIFGKCDCTKEEADECFKMAIKTLNQESIIDKIRAEINELPSYVAKFNGGDFAIHIDKEKVFDIIDKYKAESEDKK